MASSSSSSSSSSSISSSSKIPGSNSNGGNRNQKRASSSSSLSSDASGLLKGQITRLRSITNNLQYAYNGIDAPRATGEFRGSFFFAFDTTFRPFHSGQIAFSLLTMWHLKLNCTLLTFYYFTFFCSLLFSSIAFSHGGLNEDAGKMKEDANYTCCFVVKWKNVILLFTLPFAVCLLFGCRCTWVFLFTFFLPLPGSNWLMFYSFRCNNSSKAKYLSSNAGCFRWVKTLTSAL